MRLWSLHPRLLDARGLVALWREGLLAQKVLLGETRGYRHHPQLTRFREQRDPLRAVGAYLSAVVLESRRRGYRFDNTKIRFPGKVRGRISVSRGQLNYERAFLLQKLRLRDRKAFARLRAEGTCRAHPLFRVVAGEVEAWERPKPCRGYALQVVIAKAREA